MNQNKPSFYLGWREWISLPELGVPAIKAKIDTGARTSALHTYFLEPFEENGIQMVRFGLHPLQKNDTSLICQAPVKDQRVVTDSGGHREMRYVIRTPLALGNHVWPIEITLTNRENMIFRMLLGRTAMGKSVGVWPSKSFLLGRELSNAYAKNPEGDPQ